MVDVNQKTLSYIAGSLFDLAGIAFIIGHRYAMGAAFIALGAFWFVYPAIIRKRDS